MTASRSTACHCRCTPPPRRSTDRVKLLATKPGRHRRRRAGAAFRRVSFWVGEENALSLAHFHGRRQDDRSTATSPPATEGEFAGAPWPTCQRARSRPYDRQAKQQRQPWHRGHRHLAGRARPLFHRRRSRCESRIARPSGPGAQHAPVQDPDGDAMQVVAGRIRSMLFDDP